MDQLENKAEGAMGQDAMKDMSGGGGGGQQSGGSGGGMDNTINQGVDKFASAEGIPKGADGMLNKEVDSEASKFT
ncbi:hypothetical protein P7C71_g3881, partial [Lecanoromycetidae sp. Uapishka_2]